MERIRIRSQYPPKHDVRRCSTRDLTAAPASHAVHHRATAVFARHSGREWCESKDRDLLRVKAQQGYGGEGVRQRQWKWRRERV